MGAYRHYLTESGKIPSGKKSFLVAKVKIGKELVKQVAIINRLMYA